MKVVHLCSSDSGGAANAAIRLHHGLLQSGVESHFVSKLHHPINFEQNYYYFRDKSLRHYLDYCLEHFVLKGIFPPEKGYSEDTVLFTSPHSLFHPENHELIKSADLVHLHWISHFIDYGTFFKKIKKPIVWTLHDMNPFTGGCHYSGNCINYKNDCEFCPQLERTNQPSASLSYLNYKEKALNNFNSLTIVSPSLWLLNLSLKSKLFRERPHFHIVNGFDTNIFQVGDKQGFKKKWNIPSNKISLLFVAHSLKNKMKGFDILLRAIKAVPIDRIHLTVVGKLSSDFDLDFIDHLVTGHLTNERDIAELYNAADVFITPSLRDNLPNTVVESFLCGTPVIGFKIGGISEMIKDGFNGVLSEEATSSSLSNSIMRFLNNPNIFNRNQIHDRAAEIYNIKNVTDRYVDLYRSLLSE